MRDRNKDKEGHGRKNKDIEGHEGKNKDIKGKIKTDERRTLKFIVVTNVVFKKERQNEDIKRKIRTLKEK